jgi:hypothetical protein
MKKFCLILGCASALALHSAAQVSGGHFAGRWNLTVTRGDAVYPSWMEVAGKDGTVEVRAQDREGSVHPVPAEVAGGKLVVTMSAPANPRAFAEGKAAAPARPARVWEFTVAAGGLEGVVKTGDAVQARIRGVKAPVLKRAAPAAWSKPEPLFNGKDLSGWETMNHTQNPRAAENHWVAKNGELVNEAKGHNIRTTRTFDDFKLHVEYNLDAGANSGIYLRGRYECQMPPPAVRADGRPPGYAIYGMIPAAVGAPSAPGEWHAYDITLVGRYVTLVVDGVKLVDHMEIAGITGGALDSDEGEPGPIYFQGDHTGGIRYRNITISVPRGGKR